MLISVHQPVYLPGIIFFNKVALSEVVVFIGNVQLEKSSWQTRNQIRDGGSNNAQYLSVPIRSKGNYGQTIDQTKINGTHWVKKHLRSIFLTYKNRPYFDEYYNLIEILLTRKWENLSELNIAIIAELMGLLGISTKIIDAADLSLAGSGTERLVSICKELNANGYISNKGAAEYLEESLFFDAGVSHYWQKFEHPVYTQGLEFMSNLSVIDILFNLGPGAGPLVRDCGLISEQAPYRKQF